MTRVGGGDLSAQLKQWSKSQGLGNDVSKLNVGQMQEAARELKVPMGDLVKARESIVAKSAAKTETAGQAFQSTREMSKGASLNYGGVGRADRSPAMGRFAFEPKLGGKGRVGGGYRGKGFSGKSEFRPRLSTKGGGRFEPKVQTKNDAAIRRREDRALTTQYFKSGYSYSDAEKVMEHFNTKNIGQAKAYIGLKIAQNNEFILKDIGVTPQPFDQHEMMDAYFNSKTFGYNDAEKALNTFGFLDNITDAKAYIGLKVINGTEDILFDRGIGGVDDDGFSEGGAALYFKSNYSYSDVERVMDAFNIATPERAKVYISDKISMGNQFILDDIGVTQHPFDDHEQMDAFYNSKTYSLADAERALDAFSFLSNMSDAKGYIGLKIINGTEEILHDVGIGAPVDEPSSHDGVAANALFDLVASAPKLFPGSDIPYTAVSMTDVNNWLTEYYGDPMDMTAAQRNAAAETLYEAGAGVAMGVRMLMHELAENLSPDER